MPLRHAIASLGAGYAALPQMARRRLGCACIGPSLARDLSAPTPLRPYARAYAYRGLTAFASLSMAVSEGARKSFPPQVVSRSTNVGEAGSAVKRCFCNREYPVTVDRPNSATALERALSHHKQRNRSKQNGCAGPLAVRGETRCVFCPHREYGRLSERRGAKGQVPDSVFQLHREAPAAL